MWLIFIPITFASVIAFNTNRQRLSLLIISFLATSGFQLLSSGWFWSPFGFSKPYDYAFIATVFILLLNVKKLINFITQNVIGRSSALFIGFVFVVLILSVFGYGYKVSPSTQGARLLLWPLFLILFMITDKEALSSFFKSLIPIVTIISVLYLLQPLTGKNIINPDSEYLNLYVGSTETKRYLSTPDFLIFILLYFYYQLCRSRTSSFVMRAGQWLGFGLMLAVQFVSFTRSAILGTGLALIYLSKRLLNSVLVTLFLASVIGAGAIAYISSDTVKHRADETFKDVEATFTGQYLQYRSASDGNLTFRLAHLEERAAFVADEIKRWPIGLGFIHEESTEAQKLGFKTGLLSRLTGRPVQVDSGDIAWSVVVIKTGFLGLMLLCLFLVHSVFAVGTKDNLFAVIYRGGMIYYIITSFFGSNFVSPNIMFPLMLFLALALNEKSALTAGATVIGDRKIKAFSK